MRTYLRRYNMTTIEKLKNRLQSLKEQHHLEHQKVEAAEAENVAEKYLTEMKKKKLALKDEMHKVELEIYSMEASNEA
jgi:hypothetical protein